MVKSKMSRSQKCGLPPGTPVHNGEQKVDKVTFQFHRYNEHNFEEKTLNDASECLQLKDDQQRFGSTFGVSSSSLRLIRHVVQIMRDTVVLKVRAGSGKLRYT